MKSDTKSMNGKRVNQTDTSDYKISIEMERRIVWVLENDYIPVKTVQEVKRLITERRKTP